MHEFSLAQGLLEQLRQLAARHNSNRILRVRVTVGKLSGIVVDSFCFGFETIAAGDSLTRDAVLEITETDTIYSCTACGFETDSPVPVCQQCSATTLQAAGGDELILTQVEME